ncbi:heme-dependent oxidative N-demethylase subunit alpha family protein [Hydrogenophaga sp.]|uniref:heme-dependent oxidative N-demethylase subunit alpha family protein n=1 Tax=Hydrogenophaga sp. TaxID=1904254 RepID=UPI003AF5CA56
MPALTPAHAMPWTVSSPFRMHPGLKRLPVAPEVPPLFVRDALAADYAADKAAVLRGLGPNALPGEAEPAVLQAIAQAYAAQTGVQLDATPEALVGGMQEDFVVLHDEPAGMRTRFLAVCFPSNWNPAEKLGLDFSAIHAPVADNGLLQAGAHGIVDMAFRKASMLRHVWLLTPGADLSQHPDTRRTRWEDALRQAAHSPSGRLLDQVNFRVERQTTLPLPALKRGVFFIRVMVCGLLDVLAVAPGRAAELREALHSMTDAVVHYRGMLAVRERLLCELDALG